MMKLDDLCTNNINSHTRLIELITHEDYDVFSFLVLMAPWTLLNDIAFGKPYWERMACPTIMIYSGEHRLNGIICYNSWIAVPNK